MLVLRTCVRNRKLRAFALCLVSVVAIVTWWWLTRNPLSEFVDCDLRKLDPQPLPAWRQFLGKYLPAEFVSTEARLDKVLDRVLPSQFKHENFFGRRFGFHAWNLWKNDTPTQSGYILLLCDPCWMIPGSAHVKIHFFDDNAEHLGCSDFDVGNRTDLHSAAYVHEEIVGARVVVLQTKRTLGGYDSRQIYAVRGVRVALVRLEDLEGRLLRRVGHKSSVSPGPAPPNRDAAEWEGLLMSTDVTNILEALVWLGADDPYKESEITELVSTVRSRPLVQKRIAELIQSPNPWIREAAVDAQRVVGK